MQNLSVPSDDNRACSLSTRFFKIRDPFDGRPFLMCSHDPFFGTNKNRILKNGSCERAFIFQTFLNLANILKTLQHDLFLCDLITV